MGGRHSTQHRSTPQYGDEGTQCDNGVYRANATSVVEPRTAPAVRHTADEARTDHLHVHSNNVVDSHHLPTVDPITAGAVVSPAKVPTHRPREIKTVTVHMPGLAHHHESRHIKPQRRAPLVIQDTALPPITPAPSHAQNTPAKTFTEAEIKDILAIDPNRLIVLINGNFYDVTAFADAHPGGPAVLRRNNGKDITDAFFMMHHAHVADRLPEFFMGKLVTEAERNSLAAATRDKSAASHGLSLHSIRQMLQNNTNCLILIMFGDAYDVTPMRNEHPGGLRVLLNYNGKECGDVFMRVHGLRAKKQVHQYLMGRVSEAGDAPSPLLRFADTQVHTTSNSGNPGDPHTQSTRILEKEMINSAGTLQCFTFSCPTPLRLTPGGHVKLFSDAQGDEGCYYSPFQTEVASFKICIKHYPNSRTSTYLFDQPEGKEIFYEGPFAPSWELRTDAHVKATALEKRHILLLAGGTGIAPLYAIAASELERQTTSVTLVCSVQTPDDLILAEEINQLVTRYVGPLPGQPHKLRVALVFSRLPKHTPTPPTPLKYTKLVWCGTHINVDVLKALEQPPTQAAVLCGPRAFNDDLVKEVLKARICPVERIHVL